MSQKKNNLWAWLPVMGWIAVLVVESSDFGASNHTATILWKVWNALLGAPNRATFDLVHHVLRKTGHFSGYGILSLLIFRALRVVWRNRQAIVAKGREYYWQLRWAVIAMAGTLVAASADEFHQSFDPFRTSRWQDVVIDCTGALTLQVLLYIYVSTRKRDQNRVPAAATS